MSRSSITALCALLLAVLSATSPAENFYLQTPQAPNIPAKTFKLTDYGGVGDGHTLNTVAFARAIDACRKAGGGTVVVPAGTFVTGPIKLVSQMALLLEKGAVIKASGNLADFGLPDPLPKTQAELDALEEGAPLIYGSKLTDIAIRGEGTIDGNGVVWWAMAKKAPAWAIPTPAPTATPEPAAAAQPSATPAAKPAPRLILDNRPNMIVLRDCQRIHFQGVTFLNPPMFHFVPSRCRDILIEDVKVIAPDDSPNTDGIDPSNSSNVLIRRCLIDTGDDNIALKAGGSSMVPTENITVTDCTFKHGHGVSIGSETQSGVRNVLVQNCTFEGTDNGLRIKSDRTRGGTIENVAYRDIRMKNVAIPITIFLYYDEKKGALSPDFKSVTEKTPIVRNIQFLNIACDGATKRAAEIIGLPESPASVVRLENVSITNAADPMTIQDAKSLEMKNVEVMMRYTTPVPSPSASPATGAASGQQQTPQVSTTDAAKTKLQPTMKKTNLTLVTTTAALLAVVQPGSAQEAERTVAFRTADQKYITASPDLTLDLSGTKIGSKQTFTLIDVNGGEIEDRDEVRIRYTPGVMAGAAPPNSSHWQAGSDGVRRSSEGSTFKVKNVGGNYAFQTLEGKFVAAPTTEGALALVDTQEGALVVEPVEAGAPATK